MVEPHEAQVSHETVDKLQPRGVERQWAVTAGEAAFLSSGKARQTGRQKTLLP